MSEVSASSLQYHSVQCTGLEAKLADCVWTTRSANSKLKNVMTLCKGYSIVLYCCAQKCSGWVGAVKDSYGGQPVYFI